MFRLVVNGDLGFEVWQDIPGYEGLYQASTYGRIRSVERICIRGRGAEYVVGGKILRPSNSRGYLRQILCKNAKCDTFSVHRLIALTFLPKPKEGQTQINHKSEVKTDNRVSNLEWCTPAYNNNYGTRNSRSKKTQQDFPKLGKKVIQMDLNHNIVGEYSSTGQVERKTGYGKGNIINCCNGKKKIAYGYIWKYA